ncbi:hypothetical protein D3C84_1178580 [compost metagenome]
MSYCSSLRIACHSLSLWVTSNASAALASLINAVPVENFGNRPIARAVIPSPPLATRNCRLENMLASKKSRGVSWNTA